MTDATRRLVMAAGAALSLLSPAATGCVTELPPRIELYPISMAPPARTLEVVNHDDRHAIVVPVGVAFGVTTSERCTKPSTTPPPSPSMQPAQPSLAIADATILDARDLFRSPGRHEWVLFGVKSGTTTVTLKGECATQIYEVNVVTPK